VSGGLAFAAYRFLTRIGAPAVRRHLRRRAAAGREDSARLEERFGRASLARPAGSLVWYHGASVGELLSLLPLLRVLDRAGATALVTTGTVTSAEMAAERLPPGALHQYAPVDVPNAVARFLDHWRPSVAVRVDSELWPNTLDALGVRGIPHLLVNGRLSPRARARWARFPDMARRLLGTFDLVLAQSEDDRAAFTALGARDARMFGNLKAAAEPLPADPAMLAALEQVVAGRPRWLLASSHEGEEALAAAAHRALAQEQAGLLTVVVPRHPARGPSIASKLEEEGLRTALRSRGAEPAPGIEVYVADTLGELGLWYRLCPVAVIGGSLVERGGHNPLEAARLGSAIVLGPHMEHFAAVASALTGAGGALRAETSGIERAVGSLLADESERMRIAAAAEAYALREAHVLDAIAAAAAPWLPPLR
jgi:3-deoxy-D-manno-octulosonic-acid transferase